MSSFQTRSKETSTAAGRLDGSDIDLLLSPEPFSKSSDDVVTWSCLSSKRLLARIGRRAKRIARTHEEHVQASISCTVTTSQRVIV